MKDIKLATFFLQHAKKHRVRFLMAFALMPVCAGLAVGGPLLVKKAIDEGKMQAWGMMRKVGMAGSEANYLFVNIFKDFEQAANSNSIWDASVIGMNNSDIQTTSMREMIGLHYYQIEGAIQGAGKYSVHNYARPANLEGFVTENLKLWKPFFEKNMKNQNRKTYFSSTLGI